jgi:hypothetical protein
LFLLNPLDESPHHVLGKFSAIINGLIWTDVDIMVFGINGQVTEPGFLISLGNTHLHNSNTPVKKLSEVIPFPGVIHNQAMPPNYSSPNHDFSWGQFGKISSPQRPKQNMEIIFATI